MGQDFEGEAEVEVSEKEQVEIVAEALANYSWLLDALEGVKRGSVTPAEAFAEAEQEMGEYGPEWRAKVEKVLAQYC